jgi:hypothetical protein
VVLFTDKPAPPALFRMLASNLRDKASFGLVRSSESALLSQWHVDKVPSVVLVDDAGKSHAYAGANKYADLDAFVEPFLRAAHAPPPTAPSPASTVAVEELTITSLPLRCKGDKICVIAAVTSPEDARLAKKALRNLADRYHRSPLFFGVTNAASLSSWNQGQSLAHRLAEMKQSSVFILRLSKQKFYVCEPGLDEQSISTVIDKLILGDLIWNVL